MSWPVGATTHANQRIRTERLFKSRVRDALVAFYLNEKQDEPPSSRVSRAAAV